MRRAAPVRVSLSSPACAVRAGGPSGLHLPARSADGCEDIACDSLRPGSAVGLDTDAAGAVTPGGAACLFASQLSQLSSRKGLYFGWGGIACGAWRRHARADARTDAQAHLAAADWGVSLTAAGGALATDGEIGEMLGTRSESSAPTARTLARAQRLALERTHARARAHTHASSADTYTRRERPRRRPRPCVVAHERTRAHAAVVRPALAHTQAFGHAFYIGRTTASAHALPVEPTDPRHTAH